MTTEKRTKNLTKTLIESEQLLEQVERDPDGRYTIWDLFPGFGLVVYPTGAGSEAGDNTPAGQKQFFVEFGAKDDTGRITIGEYGTITVEQARELANMIVAWAGLGEDMGTLGETAKRVVESLVDCPYRNKIRFREMVVESLIKVKKNPTG